MAKFKLNLKGDWKSLAIAHGEKVGLAVVGVVVLLFLWSALGQEGLPDSQGPQALQSLTEQAKNHIARSHWEEYPQRPALPPIGPQSIMKPLELAPYKTRVAYDPPLWPKKVKRADPQLFTAIELEVHAGYAPFALRDPNAERAAAESSRPTKRAGGGLFGQPKPRGGGLFGDPTPAGGLVDEGGAAAEQLSRPLPAWFEAGGVHPGSSDKIEGRRWVVVTALVPVAKQQDEYERVFQDAEGYEPQADVPHYFGYFIERAEVNPSAQPTWQQIDVVSERKLATLKTDWGGGENLNEVADERYVHRDFTYPLGPRVLTDWDVEVIHSKTPRAPTREELEAMQAAEQEDEPEPEPEKKEEEFDPLKDLGVTGRRPSDPTEALPNSRTPVRRPVAPSRRGPVDLDGESSGHLALPPAPFYLLRYFDFNVEPGKKYQYRVRLAMRDPNYERTSGGGSGGEALQRVPNKFLEQAVIDRFNAQPVEAKRKVRFTDWSAPSPVIEPLVEQGMLAAEVSAPLKGRVNDRPSGTIWVKNFDFRTGMEVVAERTLARAGTTNFVADLEAIDPLRMELTKLKQFPVAVDATLVDLRGGEKLGTRDPELTAPGEFLVLDPQGNLHVHDEIDDRLEVENIRGLLHEEAAPADGALFDGLGAAPPEDEGGLLGPTPNGRNRRPARPVRQPRTPRNSP